MLERLTALVAEKAAELAAYDGVPAAAVHIHGAAHQLGVLLTQARDKLMAPLAPGQAVRRRAEAITAGIGGAAEAEIEAAGGAALLEAEGTLAEAAAALTAPIGAMQTSEAAAPTNQAPNAEEVNGAPTDATEGGKSAEGAVKA